MRHQEIQTYYKNHYFSSHRDMGCVKRLVGLVDVVVIFVNDSQSKWTELAQRQYRSTQHSAMQYILKTAHSRGVKLRIRNAYLTANVSLACGRDNYAQWTQAITTQFGSPDLPSFQRSFKAKHLCDEAPVLFVFNRTFRSNALSADWECRMAGEMARISAPAKERTIVHELLHQFGAVDLYYPDEVHTMIQNMRYNSVMAWSTSMEIDSLTSYLIGWSDSINVAAEQILSRTSHFTRDYMFAAIKREYQRR